MLPVLLAHIVIIGYLKNIVILLIIMRYILLLLVKKLIHMSDHEISFCYFETTLLFLEHQQS